MSILAKPSICLLCYNLQTPIHVFCFMFFTDIKVHVLLMSYVITKLKNQPQKGFYLSSRTADLYGVYIGSHSSDLCPFAIQLQ